MQESSLGSGTTAASVSTTTTTTTTSTAVFPAPVVRAKTAPRSSALSIRLPRETYRSRTRPGHPVSLISFPATPGKNPNQTEEATANNRAFAFSYAKPGWSTSANPSKGTNGTSANSGAKVFGSISTGGNTRELVGGPQEDEGTGAERWVSEGAKSLRVPKPSHSAKKLAKPTAIYLGASTNAGMERNAMPFLPPYYAKTRNGSPYFAKDFDWGEEFYKGENSAAAPSVRYNIDSNKIGKNKPPRNKTATPRLRRGLLQTPKAKSSKIVGNSSKSASVGMTLSSEVQEDEQGQSGRGSNDLTVGPSNKMMNVLTRAARSPISMSLSSNKLNETKFQVNRSPEEREESPESIRLDGLGLKSFPLIGGGEGPSLKLLSLQHNLISRLENLVPAQLNHLVVLDLYDNRLERITGLTGLSSLRVLLLGKNRIRRIEGLEGLKRLEILDLHGNQLRYVDNLGSLSSLRVLNLAGNLLRSIRNLGPYGLSSLTELNLKRNRIRNLDGLQKAPHLKKLLLANNDLQSFGSLFPLRKLLFLQEVLLHPNPLCSVPDYRSQVLTVFPWLITLDRLALTDPMRLEAKLWHRKKLAEDEERRKEETRLRVGSPTGGPPGSREQTIYQARRRWQSVKNFVKNTNSSKPTNPSSSTISGDGIGESLSLSPKKGFRNRDFVREMRTGLSNLDSELDRHEESTMVSSSSNNNNNDMTSSVVPADPCPPLMINDLEPTHREDYVNTNPPLTKTTSVVPTTAHSQILPPPTLLAATPKLGYLASYPLPVSVLSSQSGEMDSGIANIASKIEEIPALRCQQPGDDEAEGGPTDLSTNHPTSRRRALSRDEDKIGAITDGTNTDIDIGGAGSGGYHPTSSGFEERLGGGGSGDSKSMRIAVVRPVVRESNLNETMSPPPNTNLPPPTNAIFPQPSPSSTGDNNRANRPLQPEELKKSSQSDNNEDEPIKEKVTQGGGGSGGNDDFCAGTTNPMSSFQAELDPEKSDKSPIPLPTTRRCSSDLHNNISHADATSSDPDLDKIKSLDNKTSSSPTSKPDSTVPNTKGPTINNNIPSKRNLLRRSASTLGLPNLPKPKESTVEQVSEICPTFGRKDKEASCMTSGSGGGGSGGGGGVDRIGLDSGTGGGGGVSEPNVVGVSTRRRKPHLRDLRSASFDVLPSSPPAETDEDYDDDDDDDTCSIATSSNNTTGTVSDMSPRTGGKPGFLRRQLFPRTRSQRLKFRDRIPRIQSSTVTSSRKTGPLASTSGGPGRLGPDTRSNRQFRRCDSAIVGQSAGPLDNSGPHNSSSPFKKQGTDYLVEIDGKVLSIYGQGALKHTLTGFGGTGTCSVTTAKFHYISYDSIIPYFGKLRQIYPSLEHFQFRANNISIVSQLNALSDLQGLSSLHISKEGNPLVSQDCWVHYASYRLSHWGLQNVNGKEVGSEYRGGQVASSKCFESLGFLALSCLPQTALTPLAKRLHMLHCFCCCSPSSSSEESGRPNNKGLNSAINGRPGSPTDQPGSSSGNICTSWDDDPVLLDVIGKEALVYCHNPSRPRLLSPTPISEAAESQNQGCSSNSLNKNLDFSDGKRKDTLTEIANSGIEILEKLDMLEKSWPSLMTDMVQEILMDYMFFDNYMKKELKKCQDSTTIALHSHNGKKSNHHTH